MKKRWRRNKSDGKNIPILMDREELLDKKCLKTENIFPLDKKQLYKQYFMDFHQTGNINILQNAILDIKLDIKQKNSIWWVLIDNTPDINSKVKYFIVSGIRCELMLKKIMALDLQPEYLYILFHKGKIRDFSLCSLILDSLEEISSFIESTHFKEKTTFVNQFFDFLTNLNQKNLLQVIKHTKDKTDLPSCLIAESLIEHIPQLRYELPSYIKRICLASEKKDIKLLLFLADKIKYSVVQPEFIFKFLSNSEYGLQKIRLKMIVQIYQAQCLSKETFGFKKFSYQEKDTTSVQLFQDHENSSGTLESPVQNDPKQIQELPKIGESALRRQISQFKRNFPAKSTFLKTLQFKTAFIKKDMLKCLDIVRYERTYRKLLVLFIVDRNSVQYELNNNKYSNKEITRFEIRRILKGLIEKRNVNRLSIKNLVMESHSLLNKQDLHICYYLARKYNFLSEIKSDKYDKYLAYLQYHDYKLKYISQLRENHPTINVKRNHKDHVYTQKSAISSTSQNLDANKHIFGSFHNRPCDSIGINRHINVLATIDYTKNRQRTNFHKDRGLFPSENNTPTVYQYNSGAPFNRTRNIATSVASDSTNDTAFICSSDIAKTLQSEGKNVHHSEESKKHDYFLPSDFLTDQKDTFIQYELFFLNNTLILPDNLNYTSTTLLYFKIRSLINKENCADQVIDLLWHKLMENGDFLVFFYYILKYKRRIPQFALHFSTTLSIYLSRNKYSGYYFPIVFGSFSDDIEKKLQYGIEMMMEDGIIQRPH